MNRGDDLFGQLHYLFPQTYKAKWRDFCDRYLQYVETEHGPVCVGFKPERLDALRDELGVFMVYRTKDDELDLPERIIEDRYVDLSPSQRKAYDELVAQWWTQLDSGETIKAYNAISMLTRLRQVATGLSAAGTSVDDSTKLDFAQALIEDDPDEAYVVLSWYKAPVHELAERLTKAGVPAAIVDGDVPHGERAALVDAFQAGEGRVFLGTISTLGESVNLQRASRMILLDRSWNPAQNAQAMDRIYRIGQTKRVVVTNLIAKDTVDELRVQPVLASKDAIRQSVFGGRR
jgi:SNF2 family DNA or RNA helicase